VQLFQLNAIKILDLIAKQDREQAFLCEWRECVCVATVAVEIIEKLM